VCALTYLNSTTRSALNSSELLIMAKAYNESHTTSSWTRAACKTHQMSNLEEEARGPLGSRCLFVSSFQSS